MKERESALSNESINENKNKNADLLLDNEEKKEYQNNNLIDIPHEAIKKSGDMLNYNMDLKKIRENKMYNINNLMPENIKDKKPAAINGNRLSKEIFENCESVLKTTDLDSTEGLKRAAGAIYETKLSIQKKLDEKAEGLILDEKQMSGLNFLDNRVAARLFLSNMSSTTWNSNLMNECVDAIRSLEERIGDFSTGNESMLEKDVEELLLRYDIAIDTCKYYCDKRHSSRKSGIKRKKAVLDMYNRLFTERKKLKNNYDRIIRINNEGGMAEKDEPDMMTLDEIMNLPSYIAKDDLRSKGDSNKFVKDERAYDVQFRDKEYKGAQTLLLKPDRMNDAIRGTEAGSRQRRDILKQYQKAYNILKSFGDADEGAATIEIDGKPVRIVKKDKKIHILKGHKLIELLPKAEEDYDIKKIGNTFGDGILNSAYKENFDRDFLMGIIGDMEKPADKEEEEKEKKKLIDIIDAAMAFSPGVTTEIREWLKDKDFNRLKTLALCSFYYSRDAYTNFLRDMKLVYEPKAQQQKMSMEYKAAREAEKRQAELEKEAEEEKLADLIVAGEKEKQDNKQKEDEKDKQADQQKVKFDEPVVFLEEDKKDKAADGFEEEERETVALIADLIALPMALDEEKFKDDNMGRLVRILDDHVTILTRLLNEKDGKGVIASVIKKTGMKIAESLGLTDKPKMLPSDAINSVFAALKNTVLLAKKRKVEAENNNIINEENAPITEEDVRYALYSKNEDDIKALSGINKQIDDSVAEVTALAEKWIDKLKDFVILGNDAVGELDKLINKETSLDINVGGKNLYHAIIMDYLKCSDKGSKRRFMADLIRGMKPWKPLDPEKKEDPSIEKNINKLISNEDYGGPYFEEYYVFYEAEEERIPELRKQKYDKKNENHMGGKVVDSLVNEAGPLFQKSVQGMKLNGDEAPDNLNEVIKKSRNDLPEIPRPAVAAKLTSMIEKSDGVITNIVVEKTLGAATIGVAYLCRIYGPEYGKRGKKVVIKLLRPDVEDRFNRELTTVNNIIKNIGGSEENKKLLDDKLDTTKKEMDFLQESKNCELGEIYNKSGEANVRSVKTIPGIVSDGTFVVMEYIEGETAGVFRSALDKKRREIYDSVKTKKYAYYGKKGNYTFEKEDEPMLTDSFHQLSEVTYSSEMKHKNIISLTKVWLKESLKGSGFYHADLHDGNIMVNEKEAVFIDFGNVKKLSEDEKVSMLDMLKGLVAGDDAGMEIFIKAFFKAMKKEPKEEDVKKSKKVWREIAKIRKEDEKNVRSKKDSYSVKMFEAMMLLLKKEGFEVPVEIENYARTLSQVANTINESSDVINEAKYDMRTIAEDISGATGKKYVGGKLYAVEALSEKSIDFDTILKEFLNS